MNTIIFFLPESIKLPEFNLIEEVNNLVDKALAYNCNVWYNNFVNNFFTTLSECLNQIKVKFIQNLQQ